MELKHLTIGSLIKEYRNTHNITQKELAYRIYGDNSFKKSKFISSIEQGRVSFPDKYLAKLSEVTGVELTELINIKLAEYFFHLSELTTK